MSRNIKIIHIEGQVRAPRYGGEVTGGGRWW